MKPTPTYRDRQIIIVALILSYMSGVIVDLYAPSLPAIAHYFAAPYFLVKNSVTVTILGLGIGSLFFGSLIDRAGHRKTFFYGMLSLAITSLLTLFTSSILVFLCLRFLQGCAASTAFLVARALLIQNLQHKRYPVGITYASIGFALGPITSPIFGSYLQYYFSWKANFIAYVIIAISLLIFMLALTHNVPEHKFRESISETLHAYRTILNDKIFLYSSMILSLVVMQNMTFPTIGPFFIENILHQTPLVYGRYALCIASGYLAGTLSNRLLLHKYTTLKLIHTGNLIYSVAVLMQFAFALSEKWISLGLLLPVTLMSFALGHIYPNVTAQGLKRFPARSGMATALQGFLMISLGTLGNCIANFFHFNALIDITILYATMLTLQFLLIPKFSALTKQCDMTTLSHST